MDRLLKVDLTSHFGIPVSTLSITQTIASNTFEIDDINRSLVISSGITDGAVKYNNGLGKTFEVVDYDGFLTSTPHVFNQGKKRCDVICYTSNDKSWFLLNELKDRKVNNSVLTKAISQMLGTLDVIMQVPTIVVFINQFGNKRCCYCNKQSNAPALINAPNSFNRMNRLVPNGIKLSNPSIERYGFELYEYTGQQTINII
ncbi:hypothetical protein [Myroides sp. N17-2]|uniref:hypothetical protein n=1 Tax=Myroides sp. N17-2 TaxID=2030799 RepID=UPI000EFB15EB|nr:hypothetical protein [Myroides sp. N17-2]